MSNFYAGQIVRIVKKVNTKGYSYDTNLWWASDMDEYNNHLIVLTEKDARLLNIGNAHLTAISAWLFAPSWLEPLNNEGENNMSVTPKELRDLKLSDEERLLREAGFVDETGKLTDAGREVALDKVFVDKRDEIVSDLKTVKKAKESK